MEALVVHLDPQMHGHAAGDGDRRRKDIRLKLVGEAGHYANVFPQRGVMRDVEVVKLAAVVIADQAGHLLERIRLEVD